MVGGADCRTGGRGSADASAPCRVYGMCGHRRARIPTFAEVPESEIGELVEQSVADESQERGFRMRSIHVGPAEELAGYFHLT